MGRIIRRSTLAFAIAAAVGVFTIVIPVAQAAPATHVKAVTHLAATRTCRVAAPAHAAIPRGLPSLPSHGRTVASAPPVLCLWIRVGYYRAEPVPPGVGWVVASQVCETQGRFYVNSNPDSVSNYLCQEVSDGFYLWILVCFDVRTPPAAETWLNDHSNLALEVYHSSTDDGATVDQYTYNGTNTQWWTRALGSDGTYLVINVNSGKCLSVSGQSTASQASVEQRTCDTGLDQRWFYNSLGRYHSGWPVYELQNDNSGLCLDVPHSSTTPGTSLWQYGCNQTGAQGFY
jgi:hypothetical protein